MDKEFKDYPKPHVTTDMVLLKINKSTIESSRKNNIITLSVLLVEREKEPLKGVYALPGGFVNIDENLNHNVKRKFTEKTNMNAKFYMEQLYTFGEIERDFRGRIISVSYLGLCNENYLETESLNPKCKWVEVNEILNSNYEVAFDHKEIIKVAIERLKGKIQYTDLAFNLLNETFTMQECQGVYEAILSNKIDNFRRKISPMVEKTGLYEQGKQFRPAELYKKVKDIKDNL